MGLGGEGGVATSDPSSLAGGQGGDAMSANPAAAGGPDKPAANHRGA